MERVKVFPLLLVLFIWTGSLLNAGGLERLSEKRNVKNAEHPMDTVNQYEPLPRFHLLAGWESDPYMQQLQRNMDLLMMNLNRGFWGSASGFSQDSFNTQATMDMRETDTEVIVQYDIPGLDKNKIEIHLDGNMLTIKGDRNSMTEKKDPTNGYYFQERYYGSFQRSVVIPDEINEKGITADYEDGVLTIVLPKKQESSIKNIPVI